MVIVAASLLEARAVHAQPRRDSDDVEAQHAQGNRLREQGRHAEARDLFRALYERTHDPRALVRQGLAEMALSEWVAADEHLQSGMAVQGNRWVDENRSRIQAALREVQTHVGTLSVECSPPGAVVYVGDAQRATCPAPPMRLPVGPVTVRVEAPGSLPVTQTATIAAGDEPTVVRVSLVSAPRPIDPAVVESARANNRRRATMMVLGGVSLGLGVAGLGAGAAGFLVRDSNDNPLSTTLGVVGLAAGGALAIAGVVLLVAAPARREVPVSAGLCGPTLDRPGLACAWRF